MTMMLQRPVVEDSQPDGKRRLTPGRTLLAVALALVAAFAATYVAFFTPDSPPALTLSTKGADAGPSAGGAPAGVWSVGEGSVAGYRVREKLLRLPASNDAVGRTSSITGSLRLDRGGDGFVLRAGMRLDVDLTTLKSDEDRRDEHMRTMGVETDRFPKASFVSTSDVVVRPNSATGSTSAIVRGALTLHGVTRVLDVPVRARYDGSRIEVVGNLTFPWVLFEIEPPRLSYVTVEADPTLEFQLFFDHTAP